MKKCTKCNCERNEAIVLKRITDALGHLLAAREALSIAGPPDYSNALYPPDDHGTSSTADGFDDIPEELKTYTDRGLRDSLIYPKVPPEDQPRYCPLCAHFRPAVIEKCGSCCPVERNNFQPEDEFSAWIENRVDPSKPCGPCVWHIRGSCRYDGDCIALEGEEFYK